jgi:acyl-CoA thioesterase II
MGSDSVSLEQILDLEKIEVWTYRGFSWHPESTRVFGGQVAGQALVAAGRTVPADRRVHSLHAYFLRPGDTGAPLLYTVEPVRDGRSFSTRRVLAVQHGEVVFSLSASFQAPEDGIAHQLPQPTAPRPEDSADAASVIAAADPATQAWDAVSRQQFLVEMRFPEACAVTYVSDLFLLASALPPHGLVIGDPSIQLASVDHAVWFHAPFRADDWLLYEQRSSWAGAGRALCEGQLFDASGVLVASVMQEGLIRSARVVS